ncbi:MAG: hexose kinase [Bacteroidia bacterium]|nr:hexose kinase [Bacteroidia bacterium]
MSLNEASVYTLTLSPCIDKSTRVDKFLPEKKLRCDHPVFEPGGGGLNVSRVLSRFGIKSTALYISGGYTGKMLDEMIKRDRYHSVRIPSALQTRENFIVYERASHLQFRFGMPVNKISRVEQKEILQALEPMKEGGWLVISGSADEALPAGFFEKIFKAARKKNISIFCDTDRVTLKKIIPLRPDWIKPNRSEWLHFLNRKALSKKEWIATGKKKAIEYGIKMVISDGEQGAWFFSGKGEGYFYPSPSGVKVRSTVGAGDSMVAGIIISKIKNEKDEDAVAFGMACATSTVTNAESEFCKPSEVKLWLRKISYTRL